jgi:hypothetical protein
MSERDRIPHTCLILDLITGQVVHTKRGLHFFDTFELEIEEVSILSGLVRLSGGRGDYTTQYSIVTTRSSITSPAPTP